MLNCVKNYLRDKVRISQEKQEINDDFRDGKTVENGNQKTVVDGNCFGDIIHGKVL